MFSGSGFLLGFGPDSPSERVRIQVMSLRVGENWSRVGLGCWQLGDDCWGDVTEESAQSILDEALEAGVTLFDTADVYGGGLSEERIGRFLRRTGASVAVATKLGRFGTPGWPENFTRKAVREHTEASLRRLGVEALDLTQLHCVPTSVLVDGEIFEWLRELQSEGKIKAWGASIESVEEGLLCLTQPGLASLQVIFNALRQKPAEVLLPRAAQLGVAILVRLPLASGVLAGKFTATTTFAANDHRNWNRDGQAFHVGETFNGIPFEQAVGLVEELKLSLPEGWSMADAAMRWILDHEAVTSVIPGASKPGQAARNVAALSLPALPEETKAAWAEVYQTKAHRLIRGNY